MEIEPEGVQVRVQEDVQPYQLDYDIGVPVVLKGYGEIEGLPEPNDSTYLIVSILVLQAGRDHRPDLLAPDTGPDSVVRDEKGNILGVRRFQI
ncbi:MAG: hypothetical protein GY718_10145 [Lentisphaerae bacterium]|nr:hypothetical protein [Lentisphaerota bacterium]